MIGHNRRHTLTGRLKRNIAIPSNTDCSVESSDVDYKKELESNSSEASEASTNQRSNIDIPVKLTRVCPKDDVFFGGDEIGSEELSAIARLRRIEKVTPVIQRWWRHVSHRCSDKKPHDSLSTTKKTRCHIEDGISDLSSPGDEYFTTKNLEFRSHPIGIVTQNQQVDDSLTEEPGVYSKYVDKSTVPTKSAQKATILRLNSKAKAAKMSGGVSSFLPAPRKRKVLLGADSQQEGNKFGINREKLIEKKPCLKSDMVQHMKVFKPSMGSKDTRQPLPFTAIPKNTILVSDEDANMFDENRTMHRPLKIRKGDASVVSKSGEPDDGAFKSVQKPPSPKNSKIKESTTVKPIEIPPSSPIDESSAESNKNESSNSETKTEIIQSSFTSVNSTGPKKLVALRKSETRSTLSSKLQNIPSNSTLRKPISISKSSIKTVDPTSSTIRSQGISILSSSLGTKKSKVNSLIGSKLLKSNSSLKSSAQFSLSYKVPSLGYIERPIEVPMTNSSEETLGNVDGANISHIYESAKEVPSTEVINATVALPKQINDYSLELESSISEIEICPYEITAESSVNLSTASQRHAENVDSVMNEIHEEDPQPIKSLSSSEHRVGIDHSKRTETMVLESSRLGPGPGGSCDSNSSNLTNEQSTDVKFKASNASMTTLTQYEISETSAIMSTEVTFEAPVPETQAVEIKPEQVSSALTAGQNKSDLEDQFLLEDIPGNRRLSIPRKRNSMINLQDTLKQRRLSVDRRRSLDRKASLKSGTQQAMGLGQPLLENKPSPISQNQETNPVNDRVPSSIKSEIDNSESSKCISQNQPEIVPPLRRSLRSSTRLRSSTITEVHTQTTQKTPSKKATTPKNPRKGRHSRSTTPSSRSEDNPCFEVITIEATAENPLKRKPPVKLDRPLSEANASYVRAVTKNLTQYNSGYHLATLKLIPVHMGIPRPPSPTKRLLDRLERKQNAIQVPNEFTASSDVSSETERRRVNWDPLLVSIGSKKSSPSKAVLNPVKSSCMATTMKKYSQPLKHQVVNIQKMIWLEDEEDA